MLSPYSLILDLETTSTRSNAKVTDIAALIFDHSSQRIIDHIQVCFDVDAQTGHVDVETMEWREKQGMNIFEPSFGTNHEGLSKFLNFIHEFIKKGLPFSIYANGSNFDFPILQNLIIDVNAHVAEGKPKLKSEWDFHKELCLRSIVYALFTKDEYRELSDECAAKVQKTLYSLEHSSPQISQKHNSLHDCIYEAWMLDACYRKLSA